MEYSYFFDGRSYEDITSMSYSEVKELANGIFKDYKLQENSYKSKQVDGIWLDYSNKEAIERTKWTGCLVSGYISHNFIVDKDTSKVFKYSCLFDRYSWEEIPYQSISLFSEMSDGEMSELLSIAESSIRGKYPFNDADNISLVGYCFQKGVEKEVADEKYQMYNLCIVFEATMGDGIIKYTECELLQVQRTARNEVVYESCYIGTYCDTVEEIIAYHDLKKDITDTTLE